MKFEQKNKNSIKSLFNQIAKNYDLLNNLMSFGLQNKIKKRAVKSALSLAPHNTLKILDLCTGTGDIAILFQKLLPNAEIIGVDFSSEMLSIAKSRTSEVTFLEADITNLNNKFQINTFDIIFISFGLRNLPNIDEFLKNIKPYLKKGGILSILDLGKPTSAMYPYFYLHYNIIIPILAKLFNKDITPYKYFIKSSKTYPSQKELLQKLTEAGYENPKNINYAFGIISQQIATTP